MRFESDVIPDSGKTERYCRNVISVFESDVIPDSGKTNITTLHHKEQFESDVIPDSGKTYRHGYRNNGKTLIDTQIEIEI